MNNEEPMTSHEIRQELNKRRPDRESAGSGKDWANPVIEIVLQRTIEADKGNLEKALWDATRDKVIRLDGGQQRKALDVIRETGTTGQFPLDWMDLSRLPVRVGDERIALGMMQPEDYDQFAEEERKRADHDYDTRNQTIVAAHNIGQRIRDAGVRYTKDLFKR